MGGYHHGRLRESLIAEGLLLLAESPQGDISLRALARRVGVTPNAAYRHFADKGALLVALAAEGFRQLQTAQQQAARDAPPGQMLSLSGRAYLRFAWENPALFRLMFGAHLADREDAELRAAAAEAYQALRRGVATAKDAQAEAVDVEAATLRAWGLVHGLSHLMLDGQLNFMPSGPLAAAEQVLGF